MCENIYSAKNKSHNAQIADCANMPPILAARKARGNIYIRRIPYDIGCPPYHPPSLELHT